MGITKDLSFSYGLKVSRSQACKESEGREKKVCTQDLKQDLAGLRIERGLGAGVQWPRGVAWGEVQRGGRGASMGAIRVSQTRGRSVLFILKRMGIHIKKI